MLIKHVERNYFRSLYSCNLKSLGGLNVIVGKNDSGKSNLLKALNLFLIMKRIKAMNLTFIAI
ncbi:MAG: hypothetical protein D6814_18155 [Calditrichaeota bacterium]|nr:MAG: hypothetical protein D6814_18155 [Calditrichota bacterium]